MARIAIDIRPLTDRHLTGVGFTLLETLKELLPQASSSREYILFATGTEEALARIPEFPKYPHVSLVLRVIPRTLTLLYALFSPRALDILLGEPCDAWWFPNWTILATKRPYALTVHDLSFVHTPHFSSYKHRLLVALARPKQAAKKAKRCIAVSQQTAEDLTHTWGIASSRIHTIPLGVTAAFTLREQSSDRSYRASYDLNRPYVLSLSTHEPRKNIIGILEAYQSARTLLASPPLLILAGVKNMHLPKHLLTHVHILGYIPEKHRPALVRGAQALLFPSFNEGFGLPVLEALACGTPAIVSTATPPAAFFHHGIYPVDPYDTEDIARGIVDCLSSPLPYGQQQRIHAQTLSYTWKKHAETLAQTLQRLA